MADNGVSRLGTISRYDRRFFVKSLVPEYADMHLYRLQLLKEFKMLMELNHPGIVRVYELCEIPEIGFSILMEYLPGETLADFLAQSPPRARRRRIADYLIEALEYVHAHGVTHGDLKPDNIMVNPRDCTVKLIDFGLSDTDDFTVLKIPGGTRPYAPPESVKPGYRTSMSSDIYSLGRLMGDLRPGLPYRLAMRRACRANPADRPVDATEFRRVTCRYRRVIRWTVSSSLLALAIAGMAFMATRNSSRDQEARSSAGRISESGTVVDTPREAQAFAPDAVDTSLPTLLTSPVPASAPPSAESGATVEVPGEGELLKRLEHVQNDVYVKGLAHLAEMERLRVDSGLNIIDKALKMRASLLAFYHELEGAYRGFAEQVPQGMYDKYGPDWNAMRDWPAFALYSKGVDILSELADENMMQPLPARD